GLGRRAGFCAAAVAGIAIFPAGHADFGVKALSGLLQRDFQRVFEVGATVYLRSTATATAAGGAAKNLAENVAERISKAAAHTGATHARRVRIDPGVAIAIIRGTLLFIAQDFVGFLDFLEFFFGFFAV